MAPNDAKSAELADLERGRGEDGQREAALPAPSSATPGCYCRIFRSCSFRRLISFVARLKTPHVCLPHAAHLGVRLWCRSAHSEQK